MYMVKNTIENKIWILNHYATSMFYEKTGRHFYLSKYFLSSGFAPVVFCASTVHNTNEKMLHIKGLLEENNTNGTDFVFIKTLKYSKNGISRIVNMIVFFLNLLLSVGIYLKNKTKPSIIIASSVHPLTCVAGIIISRKLKIPCIVEIRDLWPESIVEYSKVSKNNIVIKLLYCIEKWIYIKADAVVFTMPGGEKYIDDKGWATLIDKNKIVHINNGYDKIDYNNNRIHFQVDDPILTDKGIFRVIYTGSIRRANNIDSIIQAAKILMQKKYEKILFLIYGDGDQREVLEKKCKEESINNIIFKGKVEKTAIPYILSTSSMTILDMYPSVGVLKYGISPNKLFDYIASGKPILAIKYNYDMIEARGLGVVINDIKPESIANGVVTIFNMRENDIQEIQNNAKIVSEEYSYENLTNKYINLINHILDKRSC